MNIKSLLVSASRKGHLRLHPALWRAALVLTIVAVMLASSVNDAQAGTYHFRCHGDWVEEGDSKKIEVVRHKLAEAFGILFDGGTATKGVDFHGDGRTFPQGSSDHTIYDQTYEDTERESDETASAWWTVNSHRCHFKILDDDDTLLDTSRTPRALWSNGEKMWVLDEPYERVVAYDMPDRGRDTGISFNGVASAPRGIWSNGRVMYVAEDSGDKLKGFWQDSRGAADEFDIPLGSHGNTDPTGVAGDGTHIWVADVADDKIYAYRLTDKTRQTGLEFNNLGSAGNNDPRGLWTDNAMMWVADSADNKVYAYDMHDKTRFPGNDLTLGNSRPVYDLWSDGGSMWMIDHNSNDILKSDMSGPGDFAFEPQEPTNRNVARGVWSDGSTLWVVNASRATVVSHRLSDYQRTGAFNVHGDGDPLVHGICASGSVMWVSDTRDDILYAYNLPGGSRNSGKDITLHGDNGFPRGLHCDATHIWVADGDDKIFAYNHSTKARVTGQEFTALGAAGNNSPKGIWSDGSTMWVLDDVDRKVYAYAHSTKQRDSGNDLHRLRATQLKGHLDWSGGSDQDTVLYQSQPLPYGLWSDGQFMWVSDDNHNRVYHNENPKWAANAALKTLRASDPAGGLNISPGFAAATTSYTVHTNPGEWVVTLSAETTAGGGWVTYHDIDNNNALLSDADPNTGGFQFRVEQIEHNIRVTGHSRNGKATKTYDLAVSRDPVSEKRLRGLTLTNIDLDPAFSGDTSDYEDLSVEPLVTETVVTATARHSVATITINGASVASDSPYTVPLATGGANTITIVVTAEDDSTRTYTVTATHRDPVSENRLSGLTLTNIDLDPAFSGNTSDYEDLSVGVLVTETVVTPTARHSAATITVNGSSVSSGSPHTVALAKGVNTITIVVTAEDQTTRTYTVTATRSHGPDISIVGGGAVTEGADAAFTLVLETEVPTALTVNVAISGDAGVLVSGQSPSITVAIPADTSSRSFTVSTVQDQVWQEHRSVQATVTNGENYQPAGAGASATVRVEDDEAPDSTILLTVSPTKLNEGQSLMATVTMTTDREEAPHAEVSVGVSTRDGSAAIPGDFHAALNSVTFIPGAFSRELVNGTMRYRASQTIDVLVKRDDVVEDEETFVIFIHRMADLPAQVVLETPTEQTVTIPAQGPGDASLRQLALGHATLEPSFASYTQTYTAAVGHDVTRTAVSATPNHPGATQVVRLDGVTKGSLPMGLAVGENVISVVVTAEDGQTAMTYTVTVTRAAEAAEAPPPTAPLPGLSGIDTGVKATIHEGALTVTWPKHGRFCDVYVVQGLGFGNPSLPALTSIETPLHCWYIASGLSPTEVRHLEGAGIYRMEWLGSPPRPLTWDGRRNLFTVGVADIEESAQHIPKPLPTDFCEVFLPRNPFEEYTLVYYQDPDFYWFNGAYHTRDSDGSAFVPVYATEILYRQTRAANSADVVKILRPPYECLNLPSRDARLSGLTIAGAGDLDFDQDRLKYAVRVGRDTAEATVTATPTNDGAAYTVEMDGTVYADRTPPLALGPNVVRIVVTAEDDEVSNTYTVTVTRDSSVAEVEVLPGGQVAEGDAIEVRVTIDQLRIDPGPEHTFLITLAGAEACSESPPGCPPGDYAIRVILYSDSDVELASDSSDFSVVVSGLPLSDDAALLRLALTRVPLAFDPGTLTYAVSVGHDVTETTVTARPNHAGAAHEVSLDGVADLDGTCELAVGENVIAVVVTAEDGMAARTYAVTVTRAAAAAVPPTVIPDPPTHSDDATLRSLALTGATLDFAPATLTYAVGVGHGVAETTVTPTVNVGATYGVTLNGAVDADGVIPLAVGENVIAVVVTAEDGQATQTYTVTVTRAEASGLSADAWLRALELTGLPPYSLYFTPLLTDYTDYPVSVGNEVAETTVTAETRHAGATYEVTLDGAAYADGVVPLAVGKNVIAVVVTAEDGVSAKTYTVALDRAGSDDATLGALGLTGVTLNFDPATLTYPVSVGNEVAETTVTAETHHAGATYVVQLNRVPDPDGTVELVVGVNSVSVVVTAENGQAARTYTVTITRAEPLPGPAVTIGLSPSGSVAEGTEITVTMSFANLEPDSRHLRHRLHLPGRRGGLRRL